MYCVFYNQKPTFLFYMDWFWLLLAEVCFNDYCCPNLWSRKIKSLCCLLLLPLRRSMQRDGPTSRRPPPSTHVTRCVAPPNYLLFGPTTIKLTRLLELPPLLHSSQYYYYLVLLLHITSNLTSSLIPRSSSLLSSEADILSSNTKNAPQHWMIYIYYRYFNLQPCTKIQNCWYLLKLARTFNMCTRIQLKKILQLIL